MTTPTLPVLTFPDEVANVVRRTYTSAHVILEYGSGGSTFVAAAVPGKRVTSVECDPAWASRMKQIAAAHDLASPPAIVYIDIGPVGGWARALNNIHLSKFIGYAQSVWERPDFVHPDVVLVDGRFRAACFMTAYLNTERPITLLFDDYKERVEYHVIERLVKPSRRVGRMAVFDIRPEDRLRIEPWLLVATYFDAVCSFRVGVFKRKPKLKRRIEDAIKGWIRASPQKPSSADPVYSPSQLRSRTRKSPETL